MNISSPTKEPITPKVLWRYKTLIFGVAAIIVAFGYLRIITQERSYTATSILQVRFSREVLNLPDAPGVRLPLLEEEVKAQILSLTDQNFIDLVLQDLSSGGGGGSSSAPSQVEAEESGGFALWMKETVASAVGGVSDGISNLFNKILFVEDTIVSDRERQVLSVQGRLEVLSGDTASHLITISYRDASPVRAAAVANRVGTKFIEQEKKKTPRRDIQKLQSVVDAERGELVSINSKKMKLLVDLKAPSIEQAITERKEKLEALRADESKLVIALELNKQGIPTYFTNMSVAADGAGRSDGQVERGWQAEQFRLQELSMIAPESPIYKVRAEDIRKYVESQKSERLAFARQNYEAGLQYVRKQIEQIESDKTLFNLAPQFSDLLVQEATTTANLARAETELTDSLKFNEQLDDKNVSESVSLWRAANEPPFPDQQQRLLKFIVVIVLGLFAGIGAAVGRHVIAPSASADGTQFVAPAPVPVPVAAGSALDVPIIVLPEDGDEPVEDDIEFDMSFPEEDADQRVG